MTSEASAAQEIPRTQSLVPLFVGTLFLSATLLFAVQPMFAKMVLPRLGGAPGVWSVAVVFFQAVLLLGYLYAHLLTRYLPLRTAALIHIGVLVLGLLFLPLSLAEGWGRPPEEGHMFWLLALFGISVGLPFFALSANAPLLQAWFARAGQGREPYFLYGASNLGSFIALLGYPFAVEPWLGLGTQTISWSVGYLGLAALVAVTAFATIRGVGDGDVSRGLHDIAISWGQRLSWIAFAFVPSALLVAVTAHISTDIAAAPFLWVAPLAIFLLTFVLVFRDRPLIPPSVFTLLLPPALVFVAATLFVPNLFSLPLTLALHLAAYFIAAMVAHHRLYAARPAPAGLTEFYLWMSFGGVLGGAFAGLAAPALFNSIAEYPLLLLAALALLIVPAKTRRIPLIVAALIVGAALIVVGLHVSSGMPVPLYVQQEWIVVLAVLGALTILACFLPVVGVALFAALLLVGLNLTPGPVDLLASRSFFGVHRIADTLTGHRMLYHGTTLHGAQRLQQGPPGAYVRPRPLTYYAESGPLGEVARALRNNGWRLSPVALVGLGAGAMACHREDGETWEFYEIDTEVVRISRDPRYFSFLSACAPEAPITIGDARVTLEDATRRYELIVVDAFSSDAIPVHLMTREAIELYMSRMQGHGVVALHVSNRHLDLLPVVAAIARDLGLVAWYKHHRPTPDEARDYIASSVVAVLAHRDEDLGSLPADDWQRLEAQPGVTAWTDDYSNIIGAMMRRWRQP